MGIHLNLVDHDELFEQTHVQPILVNDFDLSSSDQLDKLNNLIYTSYDDDSLEVVPSCDCGDIKGEYNVGVRCPTCGTECLSVTERPLESVLWIAAPKGVDALINPEVWIILKDAFKISDISVLDWLTNPRYRVPIEKEPPAIARLKEMNVERGLNNFYRNFDSIIDLLINGKIIKKGNMEQRQQLLEFIRLNRKAIFSKHLPIPSKVAFIKEDTAMGNYADPAMLPAIDAIRTISSIENSVKPLGETSKQVRTVDVINQLSEYYKNFFSKTISPKAGWFRKHIYGSRIHFSARAVIASISKPHTYDELHLPWSLAVMFLKVHLTSKLLKRGFTPNEAIRHIYEHTLKYDILLDEIFQELISEGPEGRLQVALQRNPSLTRGSMQSLGVSKIKTNPNDNTISLSVLVLAAYNADFDGDALNLMLIHDYKTYTRMQRLAPHLYALDLNKPRQLSGFMALPAPVVANIANFVHRDGY